MSRISGCLWLVVGVILATVAGGVAYVTLQRATISGVTASSAIANADVMVAAHAVPAGTVLKEGDLVAASWPADKAPSSSARTIDDARGMVTTIPLEIGEPVLKHHLTRPDIAGENLGFTLTPGKVGVTLGAKDLLSGARIVKSGDHVDVYYSLLVSVDVLEKSGGDVMLSGASGRASQPQQTTTENGSNTDDLSGDLQFTFGTLQDVVVIGVLHADMGEDAKVNARQGGTSELIPGEVYGYVLALEPQDALVLKFLKDADAVLDLAIRNQADDTDHETSPVDLMYMIDKYQLPMPK